MSKVVIELNIANIGEFLRSKEVEAECKRRADEAVSKLGEGYSVSSRVGKTRANASISADTFNARKDNMENNSILKALR